ncbi:MAG: hypothetical protein CL483_04365 [Acidobacteria bacterium]|jgi:hypothetical protein|nr:hypothetical protein [Acidobacteriota bacterium]|tara:strand:- start:2058 stop:2945 length:888 start_codon:yes stop_codon:yes gene_type:complete
MCRWFVGAVVTVLVALLVAADAVAQRASERRVANPGETQFDVQLLRPSGGPVVPIFEGWFRNLDGTFELSFGFFNVNTEEVIEVPLGPENFVEPVEFHGMQPTRFEPVPDRDRRHVGAFTVTVPADFGDRDVVWTIRSKEQTLSVPGRLTSSAYELAGWDFPGRTTLSPLVRWIEDGPSGRGPRGIVAEAVEVKAGTPVELNAWISRDDVAAEDERPINVKWFKHQGSGEVTFAERTTSVERDVWSAEGGAKVATAVTFAEPGEYLLRFLAFNVIREFEFQCCWTNAYLPVTVTP